MSGLRNITPEELAEIIRKHGLWLINKEAGERANLVRANLRDANLRDANLEDANFEGANLVRANLRDANLRGANLEDANFEGANLVSASFLRTGFICLKLEQYTAYIMPNKTRIGCQQHESKSWLEFTEDRVSEMAHDAREWSQKYGELLKASIKISMQHKGK